MQRKARPKPICTLFLGRWSRETWVLGLSFALGLLAGCALACQMTLEADGALASEVAAYVAAVDAGTAAAPGWGSAVWNSARYPLAALVLGCTALGVVAIPVLMGVRGFVLAFSAAALVRLYGGAKGAVLGWLLFGISALGTVSVLFVLGVQRWRNACVLACDGRRSRPDRRRQLATGAACAVAVAASAVFIRCCQLPLLGALSGLLR